MRTLDVQVQMSPDLRAALDAMKPEALRAALVKAMTQGVKQIEGRVIRERLTGQGPFAVAAQRLGVVTGRLRQSVTSTKPVLNGTQLSASIGSNVNYGRAHEFGFAGKVAVPAHRRTITAAFGRPLAAPVSVLVKPHQRTVKIPERQPFRAGIRSNLDVLEYSIAKALISRRP